MLRSALLFDLKKVLCYKAVALTALLLLSYGLSATDLNLKYLPNQAVKVGDGKYQLAKDFDTSVKQIRTLFAGDANIKEDLHINEDNFRVQVFYNLKESAPWHKIYVISWDDKVFARVFK